VYALFLLSEENRSKYAAPNSTRVLGYTGESDFLAIDKRGRIVEYEIKTTHWDFTRDFKDRGNKLKRHEILSKLADLPMMQAKMPNYFYFVAPEGVIREDEIPEYAGFIVIKESKDRTGPIPEAKVVRKAPMLHDRIATDRTRAKFLDEMLFKMMAYSRTLYRQRRKHD
jgi:hypothetical protein